MYVRLPRYSEVDIYDKLTKVVEHLKTRSYIDLPFQSKLDVLQFLMDDVTELNVVYNDIDGALTELDELARKNYHEAIGDRNALKELAPEIYAKKSKKKQKKKVRIYRLEAIFNTYIHAYIDLYIHTYIDVYIRALVHTYIHAYTK
jgi:hypothetical protein